MRSTCYGLTAITSGVALLLRSATEKVVYSRRSSDGSKRTRNTYSACVPGRISSLSRSAFFFASFSSSGFFSSIYRIPAGRFKYGSTVTSLSERLLKNTLNKTVSPFLTR